MRRALPHIINLSLAIITFLATSGIWLWDLALLCIPFSPSAAEKAARTGPKEHVYGNGVEFWGRAHQQGDVDLV